MRVRTFGYVPFIYLEIRRDWIMTKSEAYILRRKKRIKLKDIAEHLHCSVQLLSYYERDERNINPQLEQGYYKFILQKT